MHQQLSVIQLLSCLNVIVPGQVVDQVRTHGCMGSHKKIEQICDEPGAPVTEIHRLRHFLLLTTAQSIPRAEGESRHGLRRFHTGEQLSQWHRILTA